MQNVGDNSKQTLQSLVMFAKQPIPFHNSVPGVKSRKCVLRLDSVRCSVLSFPAAWVQAC